jgi:hypothetical protein
MGFATGMEGAAQLAWWARKDYEEGDDISDARWFQWGYINPLSKRAPTLWYILIRLPSYQMKVPCWRDGEPRWHQLCLLFKERLPGNGKWGDGVWHTIELESP